MTLNIAAAHIDAGAARTDGGSSTAAIRSRSRRHRPHARCPTSSRSSAWRGCDHLGPVFEGDVLASELTVEDMRPARGRGAALVELRAAITADRGQPDGAEPVLDWRFVGVMA